MFPFTVIYESTPWLIVRDCVCARAKELKFWEQVHLPPLVTCLVSRVASHMSCVTCPMSSVLCHFFPFFDKVVKLVSGGSAINGAYPSSFGKISIPKIWIIGCSGTTLETLKHFISLLMENPICWPASTVTGMCITWIDLTIDSSLYKSKHFIKIPHTGEKESLDRCG